MPERDISRRREMKLQGSFPTAPETSLCTATFIRGDQHPSAMRDPQTRWLMLLAGRFMVMDNRDVPSRPLGELLSLPCRLRPAAL